MPAKPISMKILKTPSCTIILKNKNTSSSPNFVQIIFKEFVLVVQLGVAQIDQFPKTIENRNVQFAKILALGGWSRGYVRAVLEDNLHLGKVFGEALVIPISINAVYVTPSSVMAL